MRIFVGQIYIEPGINYPFSHQFQAWLGQELTTRVEPSQIFLQVYSDEFNLIFRVSAKTKITEPEIKGPTVFKRNKDVEFTIFLPHKGRGPNEKNGYEQPLKLLFDSIVTVLQTVGLDASRVVESIPTLIKHVVSTPGMIVRPKPATPRG